MVLKIDKKKFQIPTQQHWFKGGHGVSVCLFGGGSGRKDIKLQAPRFWKRL